MSKEVAIDFSDILAMIRTEEIIGKVNDEAEGVITDIYIDLTASPPMGTPVDTGVARNGWQLDTSNKAAPEVYSMVPYIGALNRGHSKQAPAGSVDAIVDRHTD